MNDWDLLIEYVQVAFPMEEPTAQLVLADLQDRQLGRELTTTDNLGRAYLNLLHHVASLRGWLREHGAEFVSGNVPEDLYIRMVFLLFVDQMSKLPMLRQLMEFTSEQAETPG